MTDYLSQSIFQPSIPKQLITDEDRRFFDAFSISIVPDGDDKVYLYAEDWCTAGVLPGEDPKDDIELSEDDLYDRFQEIIRRSNGELPWILKESSYSCSRMRPDGFGGSAVFITADDVQFCSTSCWLEQRKHETETGDIGPETDDSYLPLLREIFQALATDDAGNTLDIESLRRCAGNTTPSGKLARIAWKIHRVIGSTTIKEQDGPHCRACDGNLELDRTDTLFGIDREIYRCTECEENYIRELTEANSPIERAVKCVGCGNLIIQSSARIFYQSDDLTHFIGECCRDERLRA